MQFQEGVFHKVFKADEAYESKKKKDPFKDGRHSTTDFAWELIRGSHSIRESFIATVTVATTKIVSKPCRSSALIASMRPATASCTKACITPGWAWHVGSDSLQANATERIHLDEITLAGLLSTCSHRGMLQKARCFLGYFN